MTLTEPDPLHNAILAALRVLPVQRSAVTVARRLHALERLPAANQTDDASASRSSPR